MKNFFLLCCLALFSAIGYAETINVNKAKSIAEAFVDSRKGVPGEAVSQKRPYDENEQKAHLSLLRTIELDKDDNALYIFNGQHSFVIVSAESEYGEVLAYSDENCFDQNGEEAPFASEMIEYYRQQIKKSRLNRKAAKTTLNFGNGKLLKTAAFGQNGSFWESQCPRIGGQSTYAGCGAASMAIIMKYYNWPDSGTGVGYVEVGDASYTVDFSRQTYDWNAIPEESPYDNPWLWTDYAKTEVAKILYHAGVAAKTEYGLTGSSTYTTDIGPALVDHFRYKAYANPLLEGFPYYHEWKEDYSEDGWIEMMKKEIDSSRPFIVWGESKSGGRHIFVCDGYDPNGLFHFNLGWSGISNGYYSINSVDDSYAIGIAIIGLEPDKEKEDYPYNPSNPDTPDTPDNPTPDDGEHEYVDLGLPSRTLWAKTNIGASSEEDFGNYYAWGETKTKQTYDWSTYKYCNGSENSIFKYTGYNETLDSSDDAATANWGEDWRMPTMEEFNELRDRCSWNYTRVNGVEGYLVTGPNGNSIFLPTAGMMNYSFHTNNEQGRYWSSSSAYSDVQYASYLLFDNEKYKWYMVNRSYGHSVRPVYAKKNTPVKVSSIYIVPNYVSLHKEESIVLKAEVAPENAENKSITWSSSNSWIASVSSSGYVTANAVGSCYIYAEANDGSGIYGVCQVDVSPTLVESITLNYTTYALERGETLQLEATVAPDNADNKDIIWTTSDENVVMVTSTGKVVFVDLGSATITASSTDGSGVIATCTFSTINGILNITTDSNVNVGIYSADGKKLKNLQKGLNIVTGEDGSSKKIILP